ncbi:hypothetical protein [Shewanella livingstonensis]|uniref:Uncharacterized protein n=1 Tax=Shewanella livingstonensis TaxID=150120 RepID=A0A3G8LRQ1_9GAMM|nr:hypothetical protein [Shewanella livingstonensis]AZG71895.1 hypothetical protein EGC82_03425 [Shewanella livingstonensis]
MKTDDTKDLLKISIVQVDSYQVDLGKMICDCGAKRNREAIPDFSWMCIHMAKAIASHFALLKSTLKDYKAYYSAISQHAQSGTSENMSNLSGKWVYRSKKLTATIFTSFSGAGNHNSDFIRVIVRGRDYTLFKPTLEWCLNSMMCFQPLSLNEKLELESFILENIILSVYTKLEELTIPDATNFKIKKLKRSGHKIVGLCKNNPDSFEAKILFREIMKPVRVSLSIAGWGNIKNCKSAMYDPIDNKLTFKNRLLEIFRPQLEQWCSSCCEIYAQENPEI